MTRLHGDSAASEKPEWFGVGERLALLRAAFNQSLRDVAADTKWAHTTLSRLEREESTIDLPQFLSLSKHFHVELRWLATGKGPLFQPEHSEIIYLGSASHPQPCRAAIELILASTPGRCVLLEDHVTEVEGYGWALEVNGTQLIILPGEVKPGPISRALVDFALKGWDIRGSFDIHQSGKDTLDLLEEKEVPLATIQQWLTGTPRWTDLSRLWHVGTPPALAETVKPIFDRLEAQGEMSKEQKREKYASLADKLRALADRAEKNEEVAERLSKLLTQFKSESATEKAKQKKLGA
jgi:transcriptional regulator with XRE-family HTH domain/polyhydroxyalkanoate synthesis regulator phasin